MNRFTQPLICWSITGLLLIGCGGLPALEVPDPALSMLRASSVDIQDVSSNGQLPQQGTLPAWPSTPVQEKSEETLHETDALQRELRQRLYVEPFVALRYFKEVISPSETRPTALTVEQQRLRFSDDIRRFYAGRDYQPAWLEQGRPKATVAAVFAVFEQAEQEGLRTTDYGLKTLQKRSQLLQQSDNPPQEQKVQFELLMTESWLTYAHHATFGRVDPRRVDRQWDMRARHADLVALLTAAVQQDNPHQALQQALPTHTGYLRLKQVFADYRRIARQGGWPSVGTGSKLNQGMRHERVKKLRLRLQATGDLARRAGELSDLFDAEVTQAVKRFQKRHGLSQDGVVAGRTLSELNVSTADRLQQIEINLERWRWLPDTLGTRYVLVNITDFSMRVIENEQEVLEANVIVGKVNRQTPLLTSQIDHLVLNPHWFVPHSIAVRDKLPQLRRNAYALVGQRIRVYDRRGREIEPGSVNWQRVSSGAFPYQFRQDPGPRNALGKVKFMFPNQHSVYLHDTPSRDLFNRTERAYSSGCVRISKPIELAEYLLRGDRRWTREAIVAAYNGKRQHTVFLPEKIPVHLLYWTVWVDTEGTVQFRKDIYNSDERLARALAAATTRT